MQANPIYQPAAATRARYRVIYGGAGSGKSVFAAMDHVVRCHNVTGERVLVLRKVARTVRHSTFTLFQDIIRAWSGRVEATVRESDMTIRFHNGSEILHAGLDDVEKLKSISGVTRIWVEEATELEFPVSGTEEPDLAQIDLRLRGVSPERVPQITLTFNPTASAVRLFEYVGVSTTDLPTRSHTHYDGGRVYVQHTTYLDNPHVGTEYVEVFNRLGGVMQAVYERGELVAIDAPDQLIKYEWIKAAFEREPADAAHDGRQRLACDPARYGGDDAVIGRLQGFALVAVESHASISTTNLGKRVASIAQEHGIAAELVTFDDVGLGAGALDACRDEGIEATGFTGGASPVTVDDLPDTLQFNNLRSQGWWYLREQFAVGAVALSADLPDAEKRLLQEDLLAPRYRTGQEKRIEVEPKEGRSKNWGLKQRLGRSPDRGDTLMMGVFAEHIETSPVMAI